MLILLPPSERKLAPAVGPELDLSSLSFPALNPVREVMAPLVRGRACAPAIDVYTGVLYQALGASGLGAPSRRRLREHVAIASAMFGLVRPDDLIPAYRLDPSADAPHGESLRRTWRSAMQAVLAASRGPLLDLRSGAYVALGPIPGEAADRAIVGRVLLERDGRRTVVSHHNKATKGRLVRALVERPRLPRSVQGLIEAVADTGLRVEVHEAERPGSPARLDIVVDDL